MKTMRTMSMLMRQLGRLRKTRKRAAQSRAVMNHLNSAMIGFPDLHSKKIVHVEQNLVMA